MKNAVLLNAAKRKRRKKPKRAKKARRRPTRNKVGDGRRGPGTPKQRAYRALVKKLGSVSAAAAEWRRSGRAAANKMRMPTKWKKAVKAGIRKAAAPRHMGVAGARSWRRGVAAWNRPRRRRRKKNPAMVAMLKKAVSLEAMKTGVPVLVSALSGYFVPFYLKNRLGGAFAKPIVQHGVGTGVALVAGVATGLITKNSVTGLAAFMAALGGYLIPTVGLKVMAKLLPVGARPPEAIATAGLGLGQDVDAAVEAGIEKAMREAGLAQAPDIEESIMSAEEALRLGQIISEEQVSEASQLSPTAQGLAQIVSEEQVADAPQLSPTVGEFGLGMRGMI